MDLHGGGAGSGRPLMQTSPFSHHRYTGSAGIIVVHRFLLAPLLCTGLSVKD